MRKSRGVLVLDVLPYDSAEHPSFWGGGGSAAGAAKCCWEGGSVNQDEHNYCYCYICTEMAADPANSKVGDERFKCRGAGGNCFRGGESGFPRQCPFGQFT